MKSFAMSKNTIFNHLLRLAGLVDDLENVIAIMQKAGYQVSISQIRDWRRSKNNHNYRPVPDFALEVLFDYLFEQKRNVETNKKNCQS